MRNITELDMYLFGQSTHYDIYKKMGAHVMTVGKQTGVMFDVWAPHAEKVWVIGSFNGWDEDSHEMERLEPDEMGIYELFVPEAGLGDMYKFLIQTQEGEFLYKADPFANYAELRPNNASIVTDITNFKWTDNSWLESRKKTDPYENPMAIYEVHIGSWMRHPGREDEGFYTYREVAKSLTEYVKEMGYTHVELMGAIRSWPL